MNFPCLRLLPSFAVACIACMPVAPRAAEPVASISFAETSERTPASPAAAPESATAPPAAVVAVGIKAAESAPSRACDVILLFDTSASQMADYRRYGVEAVAALLDAARPGAVGGYRAFGTVWIVGALDADASAACRARVAADVDGRDGVRAGASALPNGCGLVVRIAARDGGALAAALERVAAESQALRR